VDFQRRFPNSVKSVTAGFMSPDPNARKNPSYNTVCTGESGHVEVVEVELNDPNAHFEELVRFFYAFHDPTTEDQQGDDVGPQ
jgi:peptide-methionine (S)-S-oxide reductase